MNLFNTITQKLFADKHGRIVLMQKPNVPLAVWGACTVINWLVASKTPSSALHLVGTIALAVWAVLEIGWGVNYFRRVLGAIVLVWIIAGLFW